MTARTSHFVAVEYRGGPKDGDRDVMTWPPPKEVRFPCRCPDITLAAPVPTAWDEIGLCCHRYAPSDLQSCQPFEVSDAQLISARDVKLLLDCLAEHRHPYVYTHQGVA